MAMQLQLQCMKLQWPLAMDVLKGTCPDKHIVLHGVANMHVVCGASDVWCTGL